MAAKLSVISDAVHPKWGYPLGKLSRLNVVSEFPGRVLIEIVEEEQKVSIGLTPEQTIHLKHFLDFVIGEN